MIFRTCLLSIITVKELGKAVFANFTVFHRNCNSSPAQAISYFIVYSRVSSSSARMTQSSYFPVTKVSMDELRITC
jgi:hypothetical protein